jgi:AcrR family transcriptional regulator
MADREASSRPYRSELRRQQAAETRRRVVAAALELFSVQGYQATTFAQLAKQAGVSVETIQKHGPKSELLQAAVELASFGVEGETDFFATDLGRSMQEVRDPDEHAGFVAEMVLAINAPSAGLWMAVVGAAQGDPELAEFRAHMLALVRGQIERVSRFVADRGWLRSDVPFDDLVEAMCVITSVETYVRFVIVDGKSTEAYKEFVRRTVRETILLP